METIRRVTWSKYAQDSSRPLISLVIPVYDLEDHLAGCFEAIDQQKLKDVEVEIVAADGKSNDKSVCILDARRHEDPRLTVICTDRIGPGRARNVGAEHANGEYVWFVDGDDLILPGSLAAIADRIKEARPDLLFLDHEAFYPDGTRGPEPGHSLVARDTRTCFTLAEEPWVADFNMASWNKVIRRNFFLARPIRFLPEWPHEDVPVSCFMMLDATSLSILNRICYRYTIDRPGSAMGEARDVGQKKHFRILNSYRTVLDEVGERVQKGDPRVTAAVRMALFRRAIWHCTTILDSGFIVSADRHEFFEDIHELFSGYLPPVYHHPGGFRGVKFRLIQMNDYRAYSLLDPANKLRVRASHSALAGGQRIWQASGKLRRRVSGSPLDQAVGGK